MIITCASCLTKYHLDDSRISAKGAKVRCSRCKHIFYVVPPPETKEEVAENFESFAKFHEELMEKDQKGIEPPAPSAGEEEIQRGLSPSEEKEEEQERFLFSDQVPEEKIEPPLRPPVVEESKETVKEIKPEKPVLEKRKVSRKRGGPSRLIAFVTIIILFILGLFYLWTEIESKGKLSSYLENPIKKATQFWDRLWGAEKEGLVIKDLTGYEERVGEISLYIIEGKVENQSEKAKKQIKVKVVIFDQNKMKVMEKETLCGRTIDRGSLKTFPSDFFAGEMMIEPNTDPEKIVPSGKASPFIVLFKDLPPQAKEFKVEIVEAPSL